MSAQPVNASLSGAFFALVRRDLLLAFRRRTELLFPVIFLLVVVSLFPLGIGPSMELLARISPGVIWIAALLALLLELLCELLEFALAAQVQVFELEVNDDVVDPLRVQQQLLQMIELLPDARRGALLLLDERLKAKLVVPQVGELLLQLRPVPIELQQLFAVFLRLFVGPAENCCQARQG